jgi:hypothetical protein
MATLTAEQEKQILGAFFAQTRSILQPYFGARNFSYSNSQLFSFILVCPITIAIASDGNIDLTETTMLLDTASYFDQAMPTAFDTLPQPDGVLSDKEFKKMIYGELRHISLNMPEYEACFLEAIRKMIALDDLLSMDSSEIFSIRSRIKQMMMSVIYTNLGKDSDEERKVLAVLKSLNIA